MVGYVEQHQFAISNMMVIFIPFDSVSPIHQCCLGNFPGTHAMDYVSNKELKVFSFKKRPQLVQQGPASHGRIKLLINCYQLHTHTLEMVAQTNRDSSFFEIVLSGCQLYELHYMKPNLPGISLSTVSVFRIVCDDKCCEIFECLARAGAHAVSFPTDVALSLRHNPKLLAAACRWLRGLGLVSSLMVVNNDSRQRDLEYLGQLVDSLQHSHLRALLFDGVGVDICEVLGSLSPSLEYLDIVKISFMEIPLAALGQCCHLRVLSLNTLSAKRHHPHVPPGVIFRNLSSLPLLEYFEWVESCNLTATDVTALHFVLTNSLPNLCHWHTNFPKLLLSVTDIKKEEVLPVLSVVSQLLQGWVGDEYCMTKIFSAKVALLDRLRQLRPGVCIQIDTVRSDWMSTFFL